MRYGRHSFRSLIEYTMYLRMQLLLPLASSDILSCAQWKLAARLIRGCKLAWRRERDMMSAACGSVAPTGELGCGEFGHEVRHADVDQ